MPYTNSDALVEANWLEAHIDNPTITILDATWHMPNMDRNARDEYKAEHIPGAIFFDIDAVSDGKSELPHMLPTAREFSSIVGAMGITNDDHVVIYDSYGLFSAARVWWMFKAFGHEKVSLLNGGLATWKADNRKVTDEKSQRQRTDYFGVLQADMICDVDAVLAAINSGDKQIIDARSKDRFLAKVKEPRAGLRSGHMPGALNLPFNALISEDKKLKSEKELIALFDDIHLDRDKPIITSCGTGVTACVLSLGLYLTGVKNVAVYDGSWTEWGGRPDTPIEPA